MNTSNNVPQSYRILTFAIIVIVIGSIFVSGSFYTVRAGEKALVFTWGKITTVTSEGLHFKVPVMQTIAKVDIRTRKAEAPAAAASKNMQNVSTIVTLNYYLDPQRLDVLYSTVGLEVENKIIAARIQETVKAVVARYTAEELLSLREQVRNEISESLTKQLLEYNIVVGAGGVQITSFEFSRSFNEAIEDKQVAEQRALTARNNLERVKVEAEQKVAQAKGEAESIRIQADAIRAQGGKEYVNLKAIEKWDGKLPVYTGGGGPLPFIEIK
ncbi:MAG: prohibitin family protein [Fibromonadaceae bacterium]|jgi:regulator of protease activity HflC (stomatin/prohibitin superfamily)|nr:prohibitin family protein [Fibromonadaceae bacterium]